MGVTTRQQSNSSQSGSGQSIGGTTSTGKGPEDTTMNRPNQETGGNVVVAKTGNTKNGGVLTPGSSPAPETQEPEKSNPTGADPADGQHPAGNDAGKVTEPPADEDLRPGIDVNFTFDESPAEDTTAQLLRQNQFGTAVMYVPGLNPKWRESTGDFTQRPLIGKHVNELLGKMKRNGIRRTEITDRLKVSLTYEEFEAGLEYTVKAYARWFKDNVPGATKAYTKDELVQKYQHALRTVVGFKQLAIFLTDPEKSPFGAQLDAGQHRKAAFMQLKVAELTKISGLTPENMDDCGFPCDIGNMDKLTTLYYRLARTNAVNVYAPDTEGDIFRQLNPIYEDFLQHESDVKAEALKSKKAQKSAGGSKKVKNKEDDRVARFKDYCEKKLDTTIKEPKRYLTLFGNATWREQAVRFTKYAFGRQSFRVSNFTDIAGLLMNKYWIKYLEAQYRLMEETFDRDLQYMMRVEDLEWLKKVGKPKENADKVRELFFPQLTDSSTSGAFRIDKSWFSDVQYAMCKLDPPYQSYTMRRPAFLDNLSRDEYIRVYETFGEVERMIPNAKGLVKDILNVGKIMKGVCHHAIFWVDPVWRLPETNEKARREREDMALKIQELYYPTDPDNDIDYDDGDAAKRKTENLKHQKQVYITLRNIHEGIKKDMKSWKDQSNINVDKSMIGETLSKEVRRSYRERFTRPPWSTMLTLVIYYLGSKEFTGVMTPWKTDPGRHEKKLSMIPARPSLESFYTPLSWSRLRALRVNDPPYNHVKRTIAAMEHAMITEEARTLALVEIDRQKVENQIHTVRMNNPDWDDERVLKTVYTPRDPDHKLGLAVFKVSEAWTRTKSVLPQIIHDAVANLKDYGVDIEDDDFKAPDKISSLLPAQLPTKHVNRMLKPEETSDYEGPPIDLDAPKSSAKKGQGKKRKAPADSEDEEDSSEDESEPEPTPSKASKPPNKKQKGSRRK